MQSEDISTFTEVDPNSHISYDATTVNFTSYSNEDAYLYKDYGAGYFENFTHYLSVFWISKSSTSFEASYSWVVANDLDDAKGLKDGSKDFLGINFAYTGGSHRIQLLECDGGASTYDNYIGVSFSTWYYLTIQHFKGDNITVRIYSDFARTNLLDTLSVTGLFTTTFRYIYVANTWNNGQNRNFGQRHMNLSFVGLFTITFYFITEGGQFRVDDTSIANGTVNIYLDGVILDLAAVPHNRSWFFMNYTWTGGNSTTNPYLFTVTANNTIWLNFVDPIIAGKVVSDFPEFIILAPFFIGGFLVLVYWLSKKQT